MIPIRYKSARSSTTDTQTSEEELMRGVLHAKFFENWKQIEMLKMGFELQMYISSREDWCIFQREVEGESRED